MTNKDIAKLKQKKYREELGAFFVEGVKGVMEALRSGAPVQEIIFEQGRDEEGFYNIRSLAAKQNVPFKDESAATISKIQTTETFPGVLAVCGIKKLAVSDIKNDQPVVVLDRINDPGNLGTIIRTADWFGVKNIFLTPDCVDLYNPKVVRSSMGSLFHVRVYESTNVVTDLEAFKTAGYARVGFSLNGKPIQKLKPAAKTLYIFGSESHGIAPELADGAELYTIPGGGAESLNVAVSVGIALYHCLLSTPRLH